MIIIRMSGGLGNQMFQYAFARAHQAKGKKVYLDLVEYKKKTGRQLGLTVFDSTIPELPKPLYWLFYDNVFLLNRLQGIYPFKFSTVHENGLTYNAAYLQPNRMTRFFGYFQSEKYFASIKDVIRRDLRFVKSISSESQAHLEQINSKESTSIHIRRGDYVTNPVANKLHGVLPLTYYAEAIKIISEKRAKSSYFVFTDDKDWARETLTSILPEYTLVEDNNEINSWEDMYLMSACKHNIMANSSFSWWASWLNSNPNKIVIAPKAYCADEKMNSQTGDLIPSEWIRI